jgi:hypothetical protein
MEKVAPSAAQDNPEQKDPKPVDAGPRWYVLLQGSDADVGRLEALIAREPDSPWKIGRDREGKPSLESAGFNGLEAEAVLREAKRTLAILSGLARVHHRAFASVHAGNVFRIHSDGRRHAFLFCEAAIILCEATVHATATVTRADGTVVAVSPPPPPPALVQSLESEGTGPTDATLARALEIFAGSKPDWPTLYRVMEIIKVGCRQKMRTWATEADLDRFGAASNRPEISGDGARHALLPGGPPKARPMTLREGDDLVRGLLRRWIAEREADLSAKGGA